MPLVEQNAALLIELLSLKHQEDSYQIEVGITHSGGFTQQLLLIDEFTYLQMNSLGPFEGQRVRLSLYSKWDPFRRTYFSTLIKMNSTFSEPLYFACSEEYVSQLLQFKQQHPPPEEVRTVQAELPSEENQPVKRRKDALRLARPIVLRYVLFSLLFVLFFLRMDDQLLNSAEAHENFIRPDEAAGKPVSATHAPEIQVASLHSEQDEVLPEPKPERSANPEQSAKPEQSAEPKPKQLPEPKPEQTQVPEQAPEKVEAAQAQSPLVELLELDGSRYEYSLAKGYVALSFDDGPSEYTRQIVDILQEHGVAANFLFIGQNAKQHPDEVRYAAEHGMPVGSHSWDHSEMTKNSIEENRTNLARSIRELEQTTGEPVTVFRPPYGAINSKLAAEAGRQHLKVLLWNRDPEDWKVNTAEQILHYFHNTDPSGGIYLLHEKAITVKALPEIIDYLKSKKLKFAILK
ncbi:polysaccharide deacetylase family protein [Paenibacillus sp. HW567]|uniref:polysaccharide deacetylase family protein n=1 Tax=Paenibacillus sp. HW567 TaxID=1034769 RepID=UPI00036DF53F|nr:polysaccharide deacetylase family protein [Paenibacillus sp. HW567]